MAKDPGVGGYMFSKEAEIYLAPVNQHIKYAGHSGASYGWTMRQMQYIATHSWEDYVGKRQAASDKRHNIQDKRMGWRFIRIY